MSDQPVTSDQLQNQTIQFTDNVPADADPEASGFIDPPPGYSIFTIQDFTVAFDQEFRSGGESYVAHQLRPRLSTSLGATTVDFLPMPCAGQTLSTPLFNRWLNFLNAAGFRAPPGAAAPLGFHPKQLIGVTVIAKVSLQLDADKQPKLRPDGTQRVRIDWCGYYPATREDLLTTHPTPPAPSPSTQPVTGFDL